MAKIKVKPWDVAKYLTTPEKIAGYLQAAFEDGDLRVILKAIDNVARAHGVRKIAKNAHLGETTLYKALHEDSHPEFETILKVLTAAGMGMTVKPLARKATQ